MQWAKFNAFEVNYPVVTGQKHPLYLMKFALRNDHLHPVWPAAHLEDGGPTNFISQINTLGKSLHIGWGCWPFEVYQVPLVHFPTGVGQPVGQFTIGG